MFIFEEFGLTNTSFFIIKFLSSQSGENRIVSEQKAENFTAFILISTAILAFLTLIYNFLSVRREKRNPDKTEFKEIKKRDRIRDILGEDK